MNTGLKDKAAVVTGGSRGIGRAVAERLAAEGARVLIVARKREALEAAAREIGPNVAWFEANVADAQGARDAIDAAMDRFGRLDVLVNNASTNPYFGPLMEIDQERAERTVQVNQWGAVFWTQLAWRAWMSEHGGRVVNISSMGGLVPEPNIGWYNGTKSALIQLTRQMAQEMGPNVTVNCVAPGVIKTDMSKAIWQRYEDQIAETVPVARLGQPEDVADAVVFLAGDNARYITGQTLVVDGGITLGQGVVPT
jgi:NAD(P)-dependent dehydrogenase (short-subunit alcohol dehydrogenase family)